MSGNISLKILIIEYLDCVLISFEFYDTVIIVRLFEVFYNSYNFDI